MNQCTSGVIDLGNWYDDNPIIFYWKTRKDYILTNHMTAEDVLGFIRENHEDTVYPDELHEDFECVEDTDWMAEHKYDYRESVIRHKPTNTYFALWNTRSGNYWSGFEMDPTTLHQVTPQKVMVEKTIWHKV